MDHKKSVSDMIECYHSNTCFIFSIQHFHPSLSAHTRSKSDNLSEKRKRDDSTASLTTRCIQIENEFVQSTRCYSNFDRAIVTVNL
jgi:hypothetical protein